jgi:hypothetical protein
MDYGVIVIIIIGCILSDYGYIKPLVGLMVWLWYMQAGRLLGHHAPTVPVGPVLDVLALSTTVVGPMLVQVTVAASGRAAALAWQVNSSAVAP